MSKAEDKARKLYDTFSDILPDAVENDHEIIKICAIKCAEEIYNELNISFRLDLLRDWYNVKQEISNLKPKQR